MSFNTHTRSQEIWNEIGLWWDLNIEDGDPFHRTFIFPWIKKNFEYHNPAKVLDLGCGNGSLIKHLYKPSTQFLGVDFSESLLQRAKEKNPHNNVKYIFGDLTHSSLFENLQKSAPWDLIISSMVLHDCSNINFLAKSLKNLVSKKGCFLFTIPHPFFNSGYVKTNKNTETGKTYLEISGYETEKEFLLNGKPKQPQPHYNFHRTIGRILSAFLNEGLVLSDFKEASLSTISESYLPKDYPYSEQFTEFPPVLLCKLLPINTTC